MNPIYAIRESPHQWQILAGISFLLGLLGTMMMLAYGWPHPLARIWLLLAALLAVFFLGRALKEWLAGDGDLSTSPRSPVIQGPEQPAQRPSLPKRRARPGP